MSCPPARQPGTWRPSSTRDRRRRRLGASSSTCRPGPATTPARTSMCGSPRPTDTRRPGRTRSHPPATSTRVVLAVDELPDGEVSPVPRARPAAPATSWSCTARWARSSSGHPPEPGDTPAGAAHRRRVGRRAAVRDGRCARGVLPMRRSSACCTRCARRMTCSSARSSPRSPRASPALWLDFVYTRRAPDGWPAAPGRVTRDLLDAATLPAASEPAGVRVRPDPVRRGGGGMADRRRARARRCAHRTIRRFMMTKLDGNVLAGRLADVLGWDATAADARCAHCGMRTERSRSRWSTRPRWAPSRAARTATACSRRSSRATTDACGSGCRASRPRDDALTCPTCLSSPSRISRRCLPSTASRSTTTDAVTLGLDRGRGRSASMPPTSPCGSSCAATPCSSPNSAPPARQRSVARGQGGRRRAVR